MKIKDGWLERIVNNRPRESKLHKITQAYEVIIEEADDITYLKDTYKYILKATIPENERGYLFTLMQKKYNEFKEDDI